MKTKTATKTTGKTTGKTTAKAGSPAPKHQRLKLALIPVLLLVLAYVIFAAGDEPVSGGAPGENGLGRGPVSLVTRSAPAATGAAGPTARSAEVQPWPEASLQFLASPNPFKSLLIEPLKPTAQALVDAEAQSVADDVDPLASLAYELERRPVNFVFRSSKQNVIMLGDEVLEKGAQLSPEVQLHDIDDRVLLLRLCPQ